MMVADEGLPSVEDSAAILAEYDRLLRQPQATNKTPVGCAMVIVGVVLFTVAPYWFHRHASKWGSVAFVVIEIVLVVIGVLVAVFGGGGGFARAQLEVQDAVEKLKAGTPKQKRDAAVCLIANAYYSDGPGMSTTFHFDEVRDDLGTSLDYVIRIEKFLIAERQANRVFTLEAQRAKTD